MTVFTPRQAAGELAEETGLRLGLAEPVRREAAEFCPTDLPGLLRRALESEQRC